MIYIADDFIKANTQSQTQETARSIIEQISQNIELDNANISYGSANNPNTGFVCVGNNMYIYNLKQEINPPNVYHALVVQNVPGCNSGSIAPPINVANLTGATELLANHMQLGDFSIAQITGTTNLYKLQITVAYGDPAPTVADPTLSGPLKVPKDVSYYPGGPLPPAPSSSNTYACDTSIIHGDFCTAINNLTTVAEQR